jgi:TolA-binding protein
MRLGLRTHTPRIHSAGRRRRAVSAAWRLCCVPRAPRGAVAAVVLFSVGCAYFNTFYNAKQLYKEAETTRAKGTPDQAATKYDGAIKKCLDLIRFHPNSRYVDDALYMVGMSHFYRGEYVQSQASFRDLLDRFPHSEFAERAWFQMGLAGLREGDVAGAASAFESLEKAFPKSDYVVEAAYRTAESRLNSEDAEEARAALLEFIEKHPQSRFVGDAELEIARTYYDEARFEEARREYEQVLKHGPSAEQRYEAELHIALTKREQAAATLADPALYTSADLPEGLRLEFGAGPADTSAAARQQGTWPTATVAALPESLRTLRTHAEALLQEAANGLQNLRKRATKLGHEMEHRIEIDVTLSLMGQPDAAIADLDQVARTRSHDDVGAQAWFQLGEIQRRLGRFSKAQEAYAAAERVKPDTPLALEAKKKNAAIQARTQASQELREAPQVLQRWRAAHGQAPQPTGAADPRGQDSLSAAVEVETKFEKMAAALLRVAEIDLFELDQPRLALREFQRVLTEFPGSGQSPRAAFAIGWIYENNLHDRSRAISAYDGVMRDYPDSPQAREARERYEALRLAASGEEVKGSSSRP